MRIRFLGVREKGNLFTLFALLLLCTNCNRYVTGQEANKYIFGRENMHLSKASETIMFNLDNFLLFNTGTIKLLYKKSMLTK